ncbi:MAG: P1 family peptidase [Bacillota bacterium]|nr:P1 family peptidase [Bacillota bacterium]
MLGKLTDVPGIRVGHADDQEALTGCTVVLADRPAVAGVDVRGSAPGTRETDLLRPGRLVQRVDAVLLTGGSAFGLAAADGVMRWLEEHGRGYQAGEVRVPIVPAAVIYDLDLGRADRRPDAEMGYLAASRATLDFAEGNVGAGCGATVGKALGIARATKSGLGSAALRLDSGVTVGALAVVNAFGEIRDPETGARVAGPTNPLTGEPVDTLELLRSARELGNLGLGHTTLVVVATDARLTKEEANKVAEMAHDGLARAIVPVHTLFDGDTVFALSTGDRAAAVSVVGALAARATELAILRAVRTARPAGGLRAAEPAEG